MRDRRGSVIDRRTGRDRRVAHYLDYFLNGGTERRRGRERRSSAERRRDWMRVGKWFSFLPWGPRGIEKRIYR